ncbi:MAG: Flavodoxin reductases (ferredoxin-NADPH reductases) family 1 [uncultured Adhaeribacter sp.]|uniref:Flavodoxin reductases (Ferredoxin-NADPH reductases) family 1 n=1 Tax=uncultured Adhaeribacter sp. TaxID=448109 RepID=A0A6J4JL80_9BACT|nr:MAG: Flavodoxin reductases (ferredoxin-NADPH reductases) family 1 [uncultured Adhaeribacter sp.]
MLRVVAITPETADAITLHLEHPDKTPIPYLAGQCLTLLVPVNGKKERRAYSLCSTPAEHPRLSVTVKRVKNGLVSNHLISQIKIGDTLEALAPLGNFYLKPAADNTRNVVLIGAGSGITPLMAMAKAVLQEETKSRVFLIYGNRNENSVIFKDQLQQLTHRFPERLTVEYIYSQPQAAAPGTEIKVGGIFRKLFGKSKEESPATLPVVSAPPVYTGRLTRALLLKILEKHNLTDFLNTEYYLCGPPGLMAEAKAALTALHVPAERIFKESFVSSGDNAADINATAAVAGEENSTEIKDQEVTVRYDGHEYTLTVPKNKTILEAALDQDIDLPFSCQAGLCTACRGKCLSGKVHLDEREGLSDAEIAAGYVLTCVGHPLTSNVVIQID